MLSHSIPPSALCPIESAPPTRIRTRIERRATVEVDIEIPAGVNAYATRVGLIIDAGARGFMTAAEAAHHGLVKIIELPA